MNFRRQHSASLPWRNSGKLSSGSITAFAPLSGGGDIGAVGITERRRAGTIGDSVTVGLYLRAVPSSLGILGNIVSPGIELCGRQRTAANMLADVPKWPLTSWWTTRRISIIFRNKPWRTTRTPGFYFRHSQVRILAPQPATAVSFRRLPALCKEATFPQVSGSGSGLWPGISDVCSQKASIMASCLCWPSFQYPKFARVSVQRPVAFPRRPVRISRIGGFARRPQGVAASCHAIP